MSKLIASSAIRGAIEAVAVARARYHETMRLKGAEHPIGFPGTAYYLPVIHSFTGLKVSRVADIDAVFSECDRLLPPVPSESVWLPYLGDALDAGVATLFAFEIIEACKTLMGPDPVEGIWLGAANDTIMRERGVEFVDGTAPGFAAIVGAAPDAPTAVRIARELQEKNLYVFMSGSTGGVTFAGQLASEGVQLGWETRLVPFGRDVSATIYSLGFANRAALSFGGVAPGDFERNLRYNKNRIFAFVLALGEVDDEKYAAAAGAINYGFPTIADTDIPEILPTGICTYEHVVANVPHDRIVERALEVRGCKIKVTKVPIPVSYGPAFEGERIRKSDVHVEFGGNRTTAFEFVEMAEPDQISDGVIEVIGSEIDAVEEGSALPLAIWVQVAGRKMQTDFEPILERQIHHLINGGEGIWHMGQRDIVWTRISREAYARGFRLRHYGEIIHAKFLSEYPAIVDKVQVTLITDAEEVARRVQHARHVYHERNCRLESMTDDSVDTFYSCLLCQSFAPDHVCMITPERLGLCGAYNWLDGKAAHEIDETGPNQPVAKGRCIDPVRGIWEGVNEYVHQNSHKKIDCFTAYSLMDRPMTSCGCFEAIVAYVPECNGVMIVNREFMEDTPVGMTFSSLAGAVGGGAQTPGFMGVGKAFITSRKFLSADGGLGRIAWMTRDLKQQIGEDLRRRIKEQELPADFLDMIADESIATNPDEIHDYMRRVGHPALGMPDLAALWDATHASEHAVAEAAPSEATPAPPSSRGEVAREEHAAEGPAGSAPPSEESGPEMAGAGTDGNGQISAVDRAALIEELKSAVKAEVTREVVAEIIQALEEKFLGRPGSVPAAAPAAVPHGRPESAAEEVEGQPIIIGEKPAAAMPVIEAAPVEPGQRPCRPRRPASEKLGQIKSFSIPIERSTESIQTVTVGATHADGGTRGHAITLGGQDCLPFHHFEGSIPNPPVLALEVFDSVSPKMAPALKEVWGKLLLDPPAMARKAVEEYGARMISVRLEGTHPEKGAKSPAEAAELVRAVLAAVDVPLIVTAHNHFASANEVMKKVAAECAGERLLLNWVEGENYRTIAGVALAYGHCVVGQSPIDVNMAKQLNILLGNMELPRERIVIDPLAGALGYGLEYTYSVMERIRRTALGGDRALAFPMIVMAGQEAWKTKEAKALASDFPLWGDVNRRAVLWEIQTAMPLVLAGADLVVLHHPESLAALRRNIDRLMAHASVE